MTSTKKSLVVIVTILILAGAGYFAYSKGIFKPLLKSQTKKLVVLTGDTNIKNQVKSDVRRVVVGGGMEMDSEINESAIEPWNSTISGYEGSYHYGYSEGESSLKIDFNKNILTAHIESVKFEADKQVHIDQVLHNVRIEENKFYSDEFNGEFVMFQFEDNVEKGLKLNGYASRLKKDKEIIDEIGFYSPIPTSFQDDDFVNKALDSLTMLRVLAVYGPQTPKIVETPNKYNKTLKDKTIFYYIQDDFFVFLKTTDKELPLRGSIQSDKFTIDGIKVGMSKDTFAKKFNKQELTDLVQIHDLESYNIFIFNFSEGILKSIEYQLYYID